MCYFFFADGCIYILTWNAATENRVHAFVCNVFKYWLCNAGHAIVELCNVSLHLFLALSLSVSLLYSAYFWYVCCVCL